MNSISYRVFFFCFIGARMCHAFSMAPFLVKSSQTGQRFRSKESNVAVKEGKDTSFSERWKIPLVSVFLSLQLVSPSLAVESIFNNEYSDPLHPLCNRRIEVLDDGKRFHYTGTAVGPKDDPVLRGCSKEEVRKYKFRRGEFYGEILPGNKVSAGDGIHEGVWEPANTANTHLGYEDVDGIRWNDGNKWIVKTKTNVQKAGEVIFYSYIGFSTLAGAKGLYDGIQRKRAEGMNEQRQR